MDSRLSDPFAKVLKQAIVSALEVTGQSKAKRIDLFVQQQPNTRNAKLKVVESYEVLVNLDSGLKTGVFKSHKTPSAAIEQDDVFERIAKALLVSFSDLRSHNEMQFTFQNGALTRGVKESRSWRIEELLR